MVLAGGLFCWHLAAAASTILEDPTETDDLFHILRSSVDCATPFALGGILFVLASRRSADGRAAT